jgi:hypothetical protein
MLIFGAGLNLNGSICSAGIYVCITFYCTTKAFVYAFLGECLLVRRSSRLTSLPSVEKVHIVWGPVSGTFRRSSPIYYVCWMVVALYAGICITLYFGERPDPP